MVANGGRIVSLDLSNNMINSKCIELLKDTLISGNLMYLNLSGNPFGDAGVKSLSDIINLQTGSNVSLRTLLLKSAEITS